MKRKVVLVVLSDLTTDQRVHKIATTLSKQSMDVTVIGRKKKDSLPLSHPTTYKTHRLSCWFQRGKMFYVEFQIRLLFWLLFRVSFDVVHANDLDTLLPAFLASKLKRKPLVYDAHEYFVQVPELVHRPFTQALWHALEKSLVPKLQYAMTVNTALASLYEQKYRVPFVAVYNVPYYQHVKPTKKTQKIVLYQGALNVGRGIELMIETMHYLPEWTLWIIGKGDIEAKLKQMASNQQNIKFLGLIPYPELPRYTVQAYVGLSLEEDLGENYRLATPNKVFDYIQALVPVVVSDLPGLKTIVENFQVGLVLKERRPQSLAALLQQLENEQHYELYQKNCYLAAQQLCWENEETKVVQLYQTLP